MPYINQERRRELVDKRSAPRTAGELNYVISRLINQYLELAAVYEGRQGPNYADINEVIGVLECAKLEAYRRIAAPYEGAKCRENGDVYTIGVSNG